MGCSAHLCHLPGLGQVGHSPKGNQWECWEPGQGPNMVGPPVLLPQTIWPTWQLDRLIFCHVAGWLASCNWQAGWLAGWLPIKHKCKPDPPLGRDILWPSVWLLWSYRPVVRCTPPVETPHGQVWYYIRQDDLWSDVLPGRDILWPSVLQLWSG